MKRGRKGLFVLCGMPGTGKSFEAACAFQDAFIIQSDMTNMAFYEEWLNLPAGKASGKKLPKRTIVLSQYSMTDSAAVGAPPTRAFGADGTPFPLPQVAYFDQILHGVFQRAMVESAKGEPLTYRNLIIDEAGTFWARAFDEFAAAAGTNRFKGYNDTSAWSRKTIAKLLQLPECGMNVALVTHDREPDVEKDKAGGPKFPSNEIQRQVCGDATGVIQRIVEDQTSVIPTVGPDGKQLSPMEALAAMNAAKRARAKRLWRIFVSQHWMSKFRGISDEMFDQIQELTLEQFLLTANYEP